MPIRIKDIANTASASSTLDFFAIDGNTNNTRKLSAFSPTFGGSLVVNGTLSTGGNATIGTSGNAILFLGTTGAAYTHYIRSATAGGAIQIKGDPTTGSRWLSLGRNDNLGAYVESININSNGLVSTLGDNETHISFVRNGTVTIGPDASATPALVVSSTLKINGTTNSTGATSGAIVVGNGTNGGIGVSGRSFFAEQVNVKALEATGTASSYNTAGGIGLVGASGSSYASIKAYTDAAGTEKTIALNPAAGAGVNIGGIGAVAGGSLLASGTVTASNFVLGSGGPSVSSTVNARASRQGLISEGTSSANVGTFAAFGTGDYTAQVWVRPTTPTAPNVFLRIGQGGVAQSWEVGTTDSSPAGRLCVRNGDSTAQLFGSTILQANTVYCVTAVRASGVTTIYLNGVSNGSGTLATNYTNAIGGLTVMPSAGFIGTPLIYNRALSAAEVLALYESGAPAQADYNNANYTSLITGDNSTFATDTGYWTKANGATIGSGSCVLPNGTSYIGRANVVTVGRRYRVQLTNTAGTGNVAVFIGDGTLITTPYAASMTFEGIATTNGNITIGTSSNVTIDTLTVIPLGLLLAPDANQPGGGTSWYDTSGNNATITLPASGVSWNVRTSGKTATDFTVGGNLFASTTYITAPNGLHLDTNGSASLRYDDNGTSKWWLYKLNGDINMYLRDMVNARMQVTFNPGSSSSLATSYFWSNLSVDSTTNSTSFNTGALTVGGGIGAGGAIFTQQNSNAIVTGLNAANTSTGAAATLRHTLIAGANTSTIEAYGATHATFPGRLRFGTNNGQIDFVPSGVAIASVNANGLIVNPLHTNARHIESQVTFAANSENYLRISSNSGGGIYGGEYGYGLTALGDPELRINGIHAGAITRLISIRTGTGVTTIHNTSNSSSKTSGALVIGDGTNGGLGVSGNIVTGGNIEIQADKGVYLKQGNVQKWTSDGASTGTSRADLYADSAGVLYFRTNGATEALSLNASQTATFAGTILANATTNAFRIANSQTPGSQTATGTTGQITWDSSYIYVCTSTNNWGRSSLSWSGGGGGGGGGGSSNIWIPASEWIPRTTNGCGINSLESTTNRVNYDVLEFDPAVVEYAQAMVTLPNNWNAGTVTAKFHWTAASGSGDVVWQLSGRAYANDDAIDQATGTAQSATDTLTAANDLDISPATSAITLAGTAANGNPVVFELSRNATAGGDTLAVDARLIGVEISYTI